MGRTDGAPRSMVVIVHDNASDCATRDPSPRSEFGEIARITGAQVASFTSGSTQRGRWFAALFGKRPHLGAALHAAIGSKKIDAIYATGEDLGLPLAALLRLRGWRGRLVCVFHNLTPKKELLLRGLGDGCFHRIVVVSERQRDLLVNRCGFDPQKIMVVRNWVDTEFFKPADDAPDDGYLMACGAENRDYGTLAQAAAKVPTTIKLFAHGFFSNDQLDSSTIPPNVRMSPRVTFSALRDAYSRATSVVLPLNNVDYAAGVTGLVEAMAMAKPVIVSRSDGIADYIDATDPGLVVKPGDAEALAEAIADMTSDRRRFDAVGARNRAWAVEHCSVDAYATRISELMADQGSL